MLNDISKELLRQELKKAGGRLGRAARHLGLNYYALRRSLEPPQFADIAKPSLAQYAIAARHWMSNWDPLDQALIDARKCYDAGTHDMIQGRHDEWVVQYLIPRRIRRRLLRPYFGD